MGIKIITELINICILIRSKFEKLINWAAGYKKKAIPNNCIVWFLLKLKDCNKNTSGIV